DNLADKAKAMGIPPFDFRKVGGAQAPLSRLRRGWQNALYISVRTSNADRPPYQDNPCDGVFTMDETKIDPEAMGQLAKALAFICGADHPATVALRAAAESGDDRDIKNARTLFLRLKQSDRRAALAMLDG